MTFAVFNDFPGLENGLPKFQDFPWLSRTSGHPVKHARSTFYAPPCRLDVTSTRSSSPVYAGCCICNSVHIGSRCDPFFCMLNTSTEFSTIRRYHRGVAYLGGQCALRPPLPLQRWQIHTLLPAETSIFTVHKNGSAYGDFVPQPPVPSSNSKYTTAVWCELTVGCVRQVAASLSVEVWELWLLLGHNIIVSSTSAGSTSPRSGIRSAVSSQRRTMLYGQTYSNTRQ